MNVSFEQRVEIWRSRPGTRLWQHLADWSSTDQLCDEKVYAALSDYSILE